MFSSQNIVFVYLKVVKKNIYIYWLSALEILIIEFR